MADQPKRHSSNKSTDTISKREPENIDPGVDETGADEDAEFVQDKGFAATSDSTTKADVAATLESADFIDSRNEFDTTAAEEDEPVQSDDGIDLLATSNYPEGTTRPSPEDSADLFDSLALDERSITQGPDSRPSSQNESAWITEDESDSVAEPLQSSSDMDKTTAEQEHPTPEAGHSFEKYTENIAQNFNQESAAEIVGQPDSPADTIDHVLADDEVNYSREFAAENSEANDSAPLSAELHNTSTSTSQDFTDDLEDAPVSELLQESISEEASVEKPYGNAVDNSVGSNQGAQSNDVYNPPSQHANGEGSRDIPAVGGEALHQTSVDIGHLDSDRSFRSDTSSTGVSALSYDNMLEESDEMRWFTIGMPILLVIVIIIMGGYVYSLQSQIDEIHVLLSSEDEDFFDDELSSDTVVLNESTLAHVNARIDNLADSVEAIARAPGPTGSGPSGAVGGEGMHSVNKDLAILAERVQSLEDKVSTRPLVLRKTSKTQTAGTAKPQTSAPKTVVNREMPKTPVIRNKTGIWAVNLMSVTEKVDAERQLKGFRDKGVAAEIQPKTISGKQWYRIQVTGFDSKQEAKKYAASVKAKLGIASVWVTR